MRTSLGLLLAAGTIAVIVLKQREVPVAESPAANRAVAPAAAAPAAVPAQQASQHWPKRALDRAADVKRQVAEQRNADGTR
jgi:hypothetical protein